MAYTAKIAKIAAEKYNAHLALSTDSDEIKEVGRECGLPIDYTRPDYLANDTCGKPEAIRDVMYFAEKKYGVTYDYVLDLDVTSPIRTLEDIDKTIAMIEADPEAKTIFSVNPCGRNPYFCMVEK